MVRRGVLKRLLIGIIYLPLYHLILYPITFLLNTILFLLHAVYSLVTGKESNRVNLFQSGTWQFISTNVDYVWTGDGEFKLIPR